MTSRARTSYSLREIAERLGGKIEGDAGVKVRQVATLERATSDTIAFLANERYLPQLKSTRAGAVIVGAAARGLTSIPCIVCANPYAYFARVSALFNPVRAPRPGIHASAVVDPSARISEDVEVGPCAVVGPAATVGAGSVIGAGCFIGDGAAIGSRAHLHSNVTIYHDCVIGDRVILHSGVVIGADGFGIAMDDGHWIKVPQIGRVVIGSDVEIGANTTVDRGALDDTVIEEGVKLDNQIQVAHNVRIGAHTAVAACTGIAGSVKVGRYCRIGGGAGITGHIEIADNVEISAFTLVTKSIARSGTYTGVFPFGRNDEWRRTAVHLKRLGDLAQRVRNIEKRPGRRKRSKS